MRGPSHARSPPSETTEATIRADSLTAVAVLSRMHITDAQVLELARLLETWETARVEAERAMAEGLLKTGDLLAQKRDTLLAGGQVPRDLEDRLASAFLPAVAPTNRMLRAENEVMPTLRRRLSPEQILLVQWEISGPNQAEMEQVLAAYQQQSEQMLDAMCQIFRAPVTRLLIIGAPLYRQQRLGLIDRMLMVADGRGILTSYSPQQEELRLQLINLFDVWRQRVFDRYGDQMTEADIDEALPYVVTDILGVLGVEVADTQQIPQAFITESELRRLLLRPETAGMLSHRAQLIRQSGRRDGAMGIAPGSQNQQPDWGFEDGPGPN